MTDRLEFGLLGPLHLEFQDKKISIGGPRQRIVLAMLLLNPDRVVSIDTISEAIWNGHPPATARTQVAICVAELRKTFRAAGFRDDVILTSSPGYMLRHANHGIDLHSFREKATEARALEEKGQLVRATEVLDEALALWRGRALCDISSPLVEMDVERLHEQKLAVQEQRTGLHLQLGRHRELISELTTLVQEHPLREQTRAQLMLAQYRAGRRAEAMETFRQGRRQFIEEIGLEPGPILRDLHEALLRDDPSVQLVPRPPKVPPPTPVPNTFPADVLTFTGRDTELSMLDGLLEESSRAVGLVTGSPGIGKSGLAVRWAYRVADRFTGGVLYANLDDRRDTPEQAHILYTFLQDLGVAHRDIPPDLTERIQLYRKLTRERDVLVLLDDVESFSQIRHLVPAGNTSRTLVTTRNQMSELIARHQAFWLRLQPLGHREAADLLGMLIGARGDAEPWALAELAELCDRLPAALRIAATKLIVKPHWTVERLVARLADPHGRLDQFNNGEQDLRRLFQSSYHRLDPDTARMFRQLGALESSEFSLHDVAAFLRIDPDAVENLVEDLVDAHLLEGVPYVAADEVRYRFLPLLGLFARDLHRTALLAAVAKTEIENLPRCRPVIADDLAARPQPELKSVI